LLPELLGEPNLLDLFGDGRQLELTRLKTRLAFSCLQTATPVIEEDDFESVP
jgi:hypothetical protein